MSGNRQKTAISQARAGDFDGDGIDELIRLKSHVSVSPYVTQTYSLLDWNGAWSESDISTTPPDTFITLGGNGSYAIAAGDLDNDGLDEFVYAFWRDNDRDGVREAAVDTLVVRVVDYVAGEWQNRDIFDAPRLGTTERLALAVGDMNDDGQSELMIGDESGNITTLSYADGLWYESEIPTSSGLPWWHASVGDVNGDGYDELVILGRADDGSAFTLAAYSCAEPPTSTPTPTSSPTATPTVTATPVSSSAIAVSVSWNLLSFPIVPADTAITALLAGHDADYSSVRTYIASDAADPWKTYRPGDGGDLTTLDHSQGFWIEAITPFTLTVEGEWPTTTAIPLSAGWNMIGYPASAPADVDIATARDIDTPVEHTELRHSKPQLAALRNWRQRVYQYSDRDDPWSRLLDQCERGLYMDRHLLNHTVTNRQAAQVRKLALLITMISVLMAAAAAPALAVPPLPAGFSGQVSLDGAPVPAGTAITAWIGQTQIGQTTTQTDQSLAMYALDAAGPVDWDPDVGAPATEGATISFRIGSALAEQTATWSMGQANQDLHLSASTQYSDTTPIVEETPIELPELDVSVDFDTACPGTLTVTLHNTAPASPPEGVITLSRYWTLESDCEGFVADIVFEYDESDLGGANEADLTGVVCYVDEEWTHIAGVVDTDANTITVSSVTHFSDWMPMASQPPARISDVTATLSGSDVALAWTPISEDYTGVAMTVDHYDIYRSTEPYFEADVSNLVATDVPASNWTDAGVAGSGIDYYYLVKAVSAGGSKGAPSNRTGIFHIVLLPGWNLVSAPILVQQTGLDAVLGAQLHGSDSPSTADRVFAWDAASQTYASAWFCDAPDWGSDYHHHWLSGYSQTTLTLGPDIGVWIQNRTAGVEIVVVAGPIASEDRQITLVEGWQLIGNAFPAGRGLDALQIPAHGSDDPSTADRIFTWDPATQSYQPSAWFCNQDWGEEYQNHWLTGYSQTALQLLPGQALWYQHRDTGIEWPYPRP